MEEFFHNILAFLGFVLWPIAGVFLIFALGAWILKGQLFLFLISVGIFAAITIAVVVMSLFAE